jgi:hypothetical protein
LSDLYQTSQPVACNTAPESHGKALVVILGISLGNLLVLVLILLPLNPHISLSERDKYRKLASETNQTRMQEAPMSRIDIEKQYTKRERREPYLSQPRKQRTPRRSTFPREISPHPSLVLGAP